MKEKLEQIRAEALAKIEEAGALEKLNEIRVSYLGKKGTLTSILKGMKDVSPEERPKVGQMVNDVRTVLEDTLESARGKLARAAREEQLAREVIDVTLPAKKTALGHRHPAAMAQEEVERIFFGMGYEVAEGPEVEYEQNTSYINDRILLRTQTAPVQIRMMEHRKPPIRVIAPGRVFRSDEADATHAPFFHQIEGVVIDKNITFSDLKGTLTVLVKELFGEDTEMRFCPRYVPFTEPGAEMAVTCFKCGGKGCRLCRNSGWIELLGCGMIHPAVLDANGMNPEEYSGFAFGAGLERIAMIKYKIDDMRLLYENDIRFLRQF